MVLWVGVWWGGACSLVDGGVVLWSVGVLLVVWWVLWPSIVAGMVTVGCWLAAPCVLGGWWVALGA
jgi:hypothetical protein